jgi:hypothetical protein
MRGCGFAAMNHTTVLQETRGQRTEEQDSTLNELGLEGTADDGGKASGE